MKTIPIGKVLLVLVGPSGSGKSTFSQNFNPREIVSSDAIRQELLGDIRRQDRAAEVFAEYHHRIRTKLRFGMRVIADATQLRDRDRKAVAMIGKEENAKVIYIVINRSVEEKTETGGWRNDIRVKGMSLIEKHEDIFNSNEKRILNGDHDHADMVIDTRVDEFDIVHPLTRNPNALLIDLQSRGFNGIRVIGDVHGNLEGFHKATDAPEGTFFIFLGDIIDYGKDTLQASDFVLALVKQGKAISLRGNHERKIVNWIMGTRGDGFKGNISHGNNVTVEALEGMPVDKRRAWEDRFLELVDLSPDHIQIGEKWMFTHGAVDRFMWGDTIFRLPKNSKIESMAMFGQTTGEFVDGYPVRKNDWVNDLKPTQTAVVGHNVHSVEAPVVITNPDGGQAVMLDTGSSKSLNDVAGKLSWMDLDIQMDDESPVPFITFNSFGSE